MSKFDKGEKIDPEDLKIYEHLSAEDLASDPDWLFAPVLVATNEEQLNITRQKCSLWAKQHNTYVFKWKTNITKIINPPLRRRCLILKNITQFSGSIL